MAPPSQAVEPPANPARFTPWVEGALGSMLGGVAIVALSESRNPCAAKASMA